MVSGHTSESSSRVRVMDRKGADDAFCCSSSWAEDEKAARNQSGIPLDGGRRTTAKRCCFVAAKVRGFMIGLMRRLSVWQTQSWVEVLVSSPHRSSCGSRLAP